MKKLICQYREMSFEQKTVLTTVIGLCFSAVLASGKLIIGLFTDYNLCIIAVYTFAILLSKLECVLGIKSHKLTFEKRNRLIALFLSVASVLYIGYMCRMLFFERISKEYSLLYIELVALISFVELGFAIAGILRTKNKGHLYRDIKIINFCIALIALLTTQMTILDFAMTEKTDIYNAYAGIGVGNFIALCAVYILIAPQISVINREHNVFVLKDKNKNNLIDMENSTTEIILCRSFVYGSFIYRATVQNGQVDGHIVRGKSLWKRMHVLLKILCCILSEILLIVWLIGRFILLLRAVNLPKRLEKKMQNNGFERIIEFNSQ